MSRTRTFTTAVLSLAMVLVLAACEPGSPETEAASVAGGPSNPKGLTAEETIRRHFPDVYDQAYKIVRCESGFDPNAHSHTNDHGLFQINQVHRANWPAVTGADWSQRYDPELNAIYARYLYDREGWRPWTCRKVL